MILVQVFPPSAVLNMYGLHVVEHVPVETTYATFGSRCEGLDRRDRRTRRESLNVRRDVGPLPAAIERHLHIAVVGAGPQDAALEPAIPRVGVTSRKSLTSCCR